jgi:hypothetical protein
MIDGVLHLHDSAAACKSRKAVAAPKDCGIEEVNHSPYSPNLVRSNYFQFQNMKKQLYGHQLSICDEFNCAVHSGLMTKTKASVFQEFLWMEWRKCVQLKEEAVKTCSFRFSYFIAR